MSLKGFSIFLTIIACEVSNAEDASEVLYELCQKIISQSQTVDRNLTFVFTLVTTAVLGTSFNYLWSLPRAQMHLSREYIPLGVNVREIIISWERDNRPTPRPMTEYWDVYKHCGLRNCDHVIPTLDRYQMEKRVLIQVRELKPHELLQRDALKIRRMLNDHLEYTFYHHRYRAVFVILRVQNKETVHSSHMIRRSGRVVGGTIMPLKVEKLASSYAGRVFDSFKDSSNRTHDLILRFTIMSFPESGPKESIGLQSCDEDRMFYVFAYNYLPARLAVPLPWKPELVSKLPLYLEVELPLTLVSLVVLPWILSIRRYRSLLRFSSVWEGSYHLLSGNGDGSLISSSNQRTTMLILCGLVSLLIQYPINLLKGEVIASPYGDRIRPSNCKIESCKSVQSRWTWFDKDFLQSPGEISILRLTSEKVNVTERESVSEANRHERCRNVSLSTGEMFNWTKLALLVQYHTLCNDPELMRLQLNNFDKKLVFELLPTSAASQPVCSHATSHGGQVSIESLFKISTQILEHDLLKYHLVHDTFYPNNSYEGRFWYKHNTQKTRGPPLMIKEKVEHAIADLEERYHNYLMHGAPEMSNTVGFGSIQDMFATIMGLLLAILLLFLTHRYCNRRWISRTVPAADPPARARSHTEQGRWFETSACCQDCERIQGPMVPISSMLESAEESSVPD